MGLFGKRAAQTVYEARGALFAAHRRWVRKDRHSCAKDFLRLAVPAGRGDMLYRLARPHGRHPAYGLFPEGYAAGHGSFIAPDGEFTQHGAISEEDFWRIVTAGVPV